MPARKTTDGRTPDGKWIDRWAEGDTKGQRTFDRKGVGDAFRDRRRRARQLGRALSDELLVEKDLTLAAWVEQWWVRHAVPNLESQTRASYKQQWGKWIKPRVGSYELRALTPRVINEQLVAKMRKAGAGEPTVRLCLALLQSMLRLAAIEERITANPIDLIAKPSALPDGQLDPVAPAVVETLRRAATPRRRGVGRSGRGTRSSSPCSPTPGCARRSCSHCNGTTCSARMPSCSSPGRMWTANCSRT